jgi:hypothetical protein
LSGAPILRLDLSPCYAFAAAILVVHLAAAASLYGTLSGAAGLGLAFLFGSLGAVAAGTRALHLGGAALRAIELAGPGKAVIFLRDGRTLEAPVGPDRTVNRYWVSLPLGAPMRRTILVTSGMLDARCFRTLRLWALWNRLPVVASRQLGS